jgi:CHAT domain-containing protein
MRIDELTFRVQDRVDDYWRMNDRTAILDRGADSEAAALWRAVRAVDSDTAPRWLDKQLEAANTALGWLHYCRYRESPAKRSHAELARALLCLEAVADDHSLVPTELTPVVGRFTDPDAKAELALTLLTASTSGADPALLDASILLMTPAAAAMPKRGPDRVVRLSKLCLALRLRHERDDSATDLDLAITAGERAVASAAQRGTDAVNAWSALAFAYWCRHRLRGDPADLRQVVGLFERVLAQTDLDAGLLSNLGAAYRHLFEHTGELAHIQWAVTLGERAVAAQPDTESDPATLAELSSSLLRRYERCGASADLWRAAELAESVVATASQDDPERAVYLATAAAVLLKRHERSRALHDLDRAVELNEQALSVLPDEDPYRRSVLGKLAATLRQRYLSAGADADLNRAATLGGWALAATPVDHPEWARMAMDLVAIHLTRYTHTGVLADVERAIKLGEQAAAKLTDCPPEWLSMLGSAYQQHYPATGDISDLDHAIDLGERSLAATEEDDFGLAGRQARLATAYWHRHGHTATRADLDRAIELGERAVASAPDDHLDLPEWLSNLAVTHLDRHRLDPTQSDVDAAIALSERAIAIAPADHPSRSRLTAILSTAYLDRIIGAGMAPDPEQLHEWARTVTHARAVAPVDRVSAHHAIGALAQAAGQEQLAVKMLDAAIAILPSVAPREAGWADQQHRLGEHLGLVGSAVAAHCAIGDPAGAVEVAELGRGVLLASQANTRIDLVGLRSRNPRLADRFRWVCERLNTPDFPADERKRWWTDYDALIADIRTRPGLEDFLTTPPLTDLRSTAVGGCVVLVNASRHRSDAVVVHADTDPVLIRLPDLRLADVEDRVAALLAAVDYGQRSMVLALRKSRAVSEVLSWLWDAVAAPVVDALASNGTHRVWWLPTGVLGLLPLHAAGHPGQPGALDALVSSYIPSLRVLRAARNRRPAKYRSSLTVALHHTPGQPELPGAASEAAVLGGSALIDAQATSDQVVAALERQTWAHFACHAVVDPISQANSGLLLHDRILPLSEVGGLRLADAELAYLSACSTANHGIRYADEVLHLASAFQLAGFRHVVASLWPLSNEIARKAANSFYRGLPDAPAADQAAIVLHRVTQDLRNEYPNRPDLWASLVHSGP